MKIQKGEVIEGKITGITKYGVFVEIDNENSGMIHISEISSGFIKDINEVLKINQTVKAVIIGVAENGKLALSIKQLSKENKAAQSAAEPARPQRDFEDMMNKFKRDSEEKMAEIKFPEPKRTGRQQKGRKE
ncbi:MAG: S1 RNA-binding domain-containing protein [Oscillospiraceae bacterium]|nr:S1 RNA-binding domain-containing protein [Oscillospiraceae bacterium]